MTNINHVVCQDYEHEMWLFITEELPAERMTFWKEHLLNCNKCTLELKEALKVSSLVKEELCADLDDFSFNKMINKAVSKRKSWMGYILAYRYNTTESKSFYSKAVLTGAFAAIAIIVLLVTHQSIPVKNIPKDLLDWEGTKVISQINDMRTRVQMINEDKWGNEIYLLDQKIEKLEKESDKFSFN